MPPKSEQWGKTVSIDPHSSPIEISTEDLEHDLACASPRGVLGRQFWVLLVDEPNHKVMVQISSGDPIVITYRRKEE